MSLGDPLDIRPIARADYGEALSTEGDHREQRCTRHGSEFPCKPLQRSAGSDTQVRRGPLSLLTGA